MPDLARNLIPWFLTNFRTISTILLCRSCRLSPGLFRQQDACPAAHRLFHFLKRNRNTGPEIKSTLGAVCSVFCLFGCSVCSVFCLFGVPLGLQVLGLVESSTG